MNLHTTIVGNADDSFFYVILSESEISHRTIAPPIVPSLRAERSKLPGGWEVYEVYAPRFFEGIAAVATLPSQ